MKKLFITLSLVAVSLSMASCEYLKKLEEKLAKGETAEVAEPAGQNVGTTVQVANPNEVRVYSNAYDGFVNVRSQPSAKSAILGRLKNGQDYLVQLGVQGKWIIVQWHNTIGYVNSSVVGYTPWKPVYLGVDGDSLQGAYGLEEGDYLSYYFVFSNGKFAHLECGKYSGDQYYGTWKLEGTDIIFTTKYVPADNYKVYHVGTTERLPVKSNMIGHYARERFSAGDYMYTSFQQTKKLVNKLVSLK